MDIFRKSKRCEIMSRVKNRNTQPEILVRSLLHRNGYRFRLHRFDLPGTPDIVLPRWKSVIFVNGCLWHGHDCNRGHLPASNREFWSQKVQKNIARDQENYKQLALQGWKTIVVWTCETTSQAKRERLVERLKESLESSERC